MRLGAGEIGAGRVVAGSNPIYRIGTHPVGERPALRQATYRNLRPPVATPSDVSKPETYRSPAGVEYRGAAASAKAALRTAIGSDVKIGSSARCRAVRQ